MDGKAKICLSDLTLERLTAYIVGLGQPKFRARQIFKWLHQKLVTDFSQMTDQPRAFLEALQAQCTIAAVRWGAVSALPPRQAGCGT